MKKRIIASLLVFAVLAPFVRALDLTPIQVAVTEKGPPVLRFYFMEEGRRLGFKIDGQMMVSGGPNSATFRFRDLATAGMKLSKSPLQPTVLFDEKNAATYLASARACLPPDATNVQLVEEIPDVISINGWTSHQYVFTYVVFGIPYRSAITFLNFDSAQQLVFEVTAAVTEHQKAYARGYMVLNSLSELRSTTSATGPT